MLKEEKLPPSPIMRGEPFNPAMRPDHQKHPDMKASQPGHSQQSESSPDPPPLTPHFQLLTTALVSARCEDDRRLQARHPLVGAQRAAASFFAG